MRFIGRFKIEYMMQKKQRNEKRSASLGSGRWAPNLCMLDLGDPIG